MQTSVLVARAVFVLRYWCASLLAFLSHNDSHNIFSVLGKGMDGRSKVDVCSVRTTFSGPHCRHWYLPVSTTGILASCAEEFAKSRELARAVSRADAILVASRCLSPLERQPKLSDNHWAHGQESFPRMVCAAPTTTTARPSSSARWFLVFCQLALPNCLLCRKMWEVTVRVPATTRQITRGSFGFSWT